MLSFVAPVRPTLKSNYTLTSFESYVGWKRGDGALFDPWLRVHHRLDDKSPHRYRRGLRVGRNGRV